MARRLNKTTLGEAFLIFGFSNGCKITKKIIAQKYRKLAITNHPDKGGDAKKFAKIAEAKEVLIREYESIKTESIENTIKSVGSVFVDWLKVADTKNRKNPFTIYKKGRTKNEDTK